MLIGAREPIAALNRVRIVETGEPLVDIRDYCPLAIVREEACPYLRRTVADMLNRACETLPAGHRFRVGTALRTLAMQARGWDAYFQKMREEHPQWPLSALRRATNRYFAPYDQKAPPGHCTGGAVDVELIGPDGEPLDLCSPLERWEAAYTWTDRISEEALRNRMIQVQTMLDAGFSNCREEFWHYSWGDSAWAVRTGRQECPYGLVEPPVRVEARFAGARAAGIAQDESGLWRVEPEAAEDVPRLCVGIFWARGKRVELRVDPCPERLLLSEDRETWREAAREELGPGVCRVTLCPEAERVWLASEEWPREGAG